MRIKFSTTDYTDKEKFLNDFSNCLVKIFNDHSFSKDNPLTVTFQGAPASGKSELIKKLSDYFSATLKQESYKAKQYPDFKISGRWILAWSNQILKNSKGKNIQILSIDHRANKRDLPQREYSGIDLIENYNFSSGNIKNEYAVKGKIHIDVAKKDKVMTYDIQVDDEFSICMKQSPEIMALSLP